MKSYVSTKVVQAFKIDGQTPVANGTHNINLHGVGADDVLQVTPEWIDKHSDGLGVSALLGGYVVIYPDSYESWSPADSFESGYVEVTDEDLESVTLTLTPDDRHPSVQHVMQFFEYEHLPDHLQAVSRPWCELANQMADGLPSNAETTVALRKLLEGKDAAVRALLSA